MLQINDFLISKDELSHRIALVGATTSMLAGGVVILGFMYHYYAPYANCGLNIFFITWTLIMALIYVALSVRMLLSISSLPGLGPCSDLMHCCSKLMAVQQPASDWQSFESFGVKAGWSQGLTCRCPHGGRRVPGC